MGLAAAQLSAVALVLAALAALLGAGADPPPRATAEVSWWRADMHPSPQTEPDSFHLRGGTRLPILGRSADSEWIALRLDLLNPAYAWTPVDRLTLNVPVSELPILVATGMEALSVDPDGSLGASYAATAQFTTWQWRDDQTIVGSNQRGLWHWNPLAGELRRFAVPQWVKFSPDGRYAASGSGGDFWTDDWTRDVVISPVDGGEPLIFGEANRYRFTHHDSDPSLRWSPDSRYVLSAYLALSADAETDEPWGYYILGVDGSRALLAVQSAYQSVYWLPDSTLLIWDENQFRFYRPDGNLLRELTLDLDASIHLYRYPDSGTAALVTTEQGRGGWHRLDLATGELTALPPPLNQRPLRTNAWQGWMAQPLNGHSAIVYWRGPDPDEAAPDPPVYLYDVRSSSARPLDSVQRGSVRHGPDVLWSDDGQRFALSWFGGSAYVIETDTLSTLELPEVAVSPLGALIDWSPDGSRLLVRSIRSVPEFDRRGFAAFPNFRYVVDFGDWTLAEYLIIDAASGAILSRFRADGNQCSNGHRAEWSPDGRWLAFGGVVVDCT